MNEADFMKGHRAAWAAMLQRCLMELGYEDTEATRAKWIVEREAAVAAVRQLHDRHASKPSDWSNDLFLADMVKKLEDAVDDRYWGQPPDSDRS